MTPQFLSAFELECICVCVCVHGHKTRSVLPTHNKFSDWIEFFFLQQIARFWFLITLHYKLPFFATIFFGCAGFSDYRIWACCLSSESSRWMENKWTKIKGKKQSQNAQRTHRTKRFRGTRTHELIAASFYNVLNVYYVGLAGCLNAIRYDSSSFHLPFDLVRECKCASECVTSMSSVRLCTVRRMRL